MSNRNIRKNVLWLALASALVVATPAFAQSTSSAVAGRITDAKGTPITGAQVDILHVPSGTHVTVTTDADGHYAARGLRVGGPYSIHVSGGGARETGRDDVQLRLNETAEVDLVAATDTTAMEAIQVVASSASTVFSSDNIGATTNVTREEIEAMPSIRRTLEDYVRFDPRIVQVDKERGGITAGGQNNRYNNIKIDGVPTNDQFGLNDSGLPSLNQPISIDWIQEFNIGVSNYDVTQTDFVGANINAVTKSGTNDFHGGVYGVYRDKDMVGDDVDGNGFKGFKEEYTYGGYVGGPIITDKLFFFAGYEKFERTAPGASTGIIGSGFPNEVNITADQLAQIRAAAATFGLNDIGGQSATANNEDKKYFAKIDWNINEDHRATYRYNKTEGQALRLNTSTTTLQLDSNYYQDNIDFENHALLFYDRWTDWLSTEANVAYAEYRSTPTPFSLFPQIQVNVGPGASVLFGRERSRHANVLKVDTFTGFFAANMAFGDHDVKLGFDYEHNDVYNLFLQDLFGNYTFPSIAAFQAGSWSVYSLQQPANGDIDSVAAQFTVADYGVFLQDTWRFNQNLTITYGFRVDTDLVGGSPLHNGLAENVFGYDNTKTIDHQRTVEPRAGFNYQFDTERLTQLRGGFGLFQGSAPGVWVSNSFSNPGGLAIAYRATNSTANPQPISFDPNNPLVPTTVSAAQLVNFLSPDFQQPTVWKSNIAFERELPWWGLIASAEYLRTITDKGVRFESLNLGAPTGTLPDGRNEYFANLTPANFANNRTPTTRANSNRSFTDVILLTNTDKGEAQTATISLEKPMSNDWYAKIGYSYTEAEEVNPGTSSVALSNWNNNAFFNPNEDVASTANYEFRNRFTAQFSKIFHFWDSAPTTLGVFAESRSGRPFSYVFSGDANGDGRSFNDLFFVPNIANGVQYSSNSSAQDIAAFENYITGNDYLNSRQGRATSRNASRSPYATQFDVHLSQKFPIFGETRGEVFLNILNFGNMLNKHWGQIDEVAFPYTQGVARMAGVANGEYVYDVSSFVNETTGATNTPRLLRKDVAGESRWALQVGFRFEF